MKQNMFLIIMALLAINVQAQPKTGIRLYGYIQQASGGMAPRREAMDDSGNLVKTAEAPQSHTYHIYLTMPARLRLNPSELWIKGTPYGVTYETKKETPIVATNQTIPNHPVTTVLVPGTNGTILQLTPVPLTESSTKKGKALSGNNELVVRYKRGGKFYYAVLKKFSEISGEALQ